MSQAKPDGVHTRKTLNSHSLSLRADILHQHMHWSPRLHVGRNAFKNRHTNYAAIYLNLQIRTACPGSLTICGSLSAKRSVGSTFLQPAADQFDAVSMRLSGKTPQPFSQDKHVYGGYGAKI